MKKTFEKCLWEDLNIWFGLERLETAQPYFTPLQTLTQVQPHVPASVQDELKKLHKLISRKFLDWNEDELKMQFISPFLFLVDYYESDRYQPFSQRIMQLQTPEIELSGVMEWMLASGKQIPREPFFFLHEYKKEQGTDADPLGQLLAAMITAQHLNTNKNRVLYGCYIVGKDWYFVALQGKQYQNTTNYNVTEFDKLALVFTILQNIKNLIWTVIFISISTLHQ